MKDTTSFQEYEVEVRQSSCHCVRLLALLTLRRPPVVLIGFWADRHASSAKRDPLEEGAKNALDANAQKRMEDSYIEVDLPFESDPALLEQYIGAFTSVRIGRIMEGASIMYVLTTWDHY